MTSFILNEKLKNLIINFLYNLGGFNIVINKNNITNVLNTKKSKSKFLCLNLFLFKLMAEKSSSEVYILFIKNYFFLNLINIFYLNNLNIIKN